MATTWRTGWGLVGEAGTGASRRGWSRGLRPSCPATVEWIVVHAFANWFAALPAGWVYLAAGLLLAAEVGLLVGVFIPAASVMLAAGALAHTGRVTLLGVLLATTAGALVGDSLGYWEGRLCGPRVRHSRLGRRIGEARWRSADALVRRGRGAVVTAGRWIAGFRTLVPRLVGAAGLGYPRFLLFNAVGVVVWVPGTVLIGYIAGGTPQFGPVPPLWVPAALIAAAVAGTRALRRVRATRLGASPDPGFDQE